MFFDIAVWPLCERNAMSKPSILWSACAALLFAGSGALAASGAASSGGNLVHDGDFSAAASPGSYATYPKGSTAITGWVVTKATVDLIGTYWTAPGGLRSVDLDGTPGFGAIAQTIATTPGTTYTLSFLLSGNDECPPAIKHMRVSAAGVHADYTVNGAGVRKNAWVRKTWTFKASAPKTTLQFESKDTSGGECGPVIADIRVNA